MGKMKIFRDYKINENEIKTDYVIGCLKAILEEYEGDIIYGEIEFTDDEEYLTYVDLNEVWHEIKTVNIDYVEWDNDNYEIMLKSINDDGLYTTIATINIEIYLWLNETIGIYDPEDYWCHDEMDEPDFVKYDSRQDCVKTMLKYREKRDN